MAYRCVATSVGGFVQQLAVSYLRHGYWFYVPGQVPPGKDPALLDEKLIERYAIDQPKWTRSRRKRAGLANVQYLRCGRFFLLLATHGEHRFFAEERAVIRDVRRQPITFSGYSVGVRGNRPVVRIERLEYTLLRRRFRGLARRRDAEELERAFQTLPFEPYAAVRRQLLATRKLVNEERKGAGFPPVPVTAVRLWRRIYRPFEPPATGPKARTAGEVRGGRRPRGPACRDTTGAR